MSQSPHEIAEKILNINTSSLGTDELNEYLKELSIASETLARAYLELGKDYEKLYSDYTNLLNSGQAKEITKLKEENESIRNQLLAQCKISNELLHEKAGLIEAVEAGINAIGKTREESLEKWSDFVKLARKALSGEGKEK